MARTFVIMVMMLAFAMPALAEKSDDKGAVLPGAAPLGGEVSLRAGKLMKRRGSFLVRNKMPPPGPDARSALERRRDQEVQLHFGRLAELDVIGKLGRKHKMGDVQEKVERLRRHERSRHRRVMRLLRQAAVYGYTVGLP